MSAGLVDQKRNHYECMSMEELQELIRQDIREDTLDSETVAIIINTLIQKNNVEHRFEVPSTEEALARFLQRLDTFSIFFE